MSENPIKIDFETICHERWEEIKGDLQPLMEDVVHPSQSLEEAEEEAESALKENGMADLKIEDVYRSVPIEREE